METMIARVQNPLVLTAPAVIDLFTAAFKNDLPAPVGGVLAELVQVLPNDRVLVCIGLDSGELKGLLIAVDPASALIVEPQVYHFFNSGHAALKNSLISELHSWLKERNIDTFIGANMTGRSDKAWLKALKNMGTPERVGSIIRFKVE